MVYSNAKCQGEDWQISDIGESESAILNLGLGTENTKAPKWIASPDSAWDISDYSQ